MSGEDSDWILKHFKRISRKEAISRVPGYKTADAYFYECDAFENNECTKHDDPKRPRMCREFPWYGRKPCKDSVIHHYPDCSFLKDIQ
jgi:hypothetical protein